MDAETLRQVLLGGKVSTAVGRWDGLRCLLGPVGRGCAKWASTKFCRLRAACFEISF